MEEYINFNDLIKDSNFSQADKNNLMSIILLLHGEKKSILQLANDIRVMNAKVQYYVDFLEQKGILKRLNQYNSLVTTNYEYELVTKEIIGTLEATDELGKKIQAKRLGTYLEESIENLNPNELNLISLAEVSLEMSIVEEISKKLKELYQYILKKEQEAIIAEQEGTGSVKRYSLLTSFVPNL